MLNFDESFTVQDVQQIFVLEKFPDFVDQVKINNTYFVQIKDKDNNIIPVETIIKYVKAEYILQTRTDVKYQDGPTFTYFTKSFSQMRKTGDSGVITSPDYDVTKYDYFCIYHISEILMACFTEISRRQKNQRSKNMQFRLQDNVITAIHYIRTIIDDRSKYNDEHNQQNFYFVEKGLAQQIWQQSFELNRHLDQFKFNSKYDVLWEIQTGRQDIRVYDFDAIDLISNDYQSIDNLLIFNDSNTIFMFKDQDEKLYYLNQDK